MITEKHLAVTHRMKECQRHLKALAGDKFDSIVEGYREIFAAIANAEGITILQAAIKCGETITNDRRADEGFELLRIFGACAEIIERDEKC